MKQVIERMSGGVLRLAMTGGRAGLGLDPVAASGRRGKAAKEVGLRRGAANPTYIDARRCIEGRGYADGDGAERAGMATPKGMASNGRSVSGKGG